jgi:hypothetical protein
VTWKPAMGTAWMAAVVLGLLAVVPPRPGEAGEWRLLTGATHFWWRTHGEPRGHFEDCRDPACDDDDYDRANLDNAIGYRLGAERLSGGAGRLRLVTGGEIDLISTEYDRSQRAFRVAELYGTAGLELDADWLRLNLRGGAGGAASDDGRGGVATLLEAGVDLPFGASALRITGGRVRHGGPSADHLSVLLVTGATPPSSGQGCWDVTWSGGISLPGVVTGQDLSLSRGHLWELGVHRRLRRSPHRLGVSLQVVEHESSVRTQFQDVSGNQRGKEIFGLSLLWDREMGAGPVLPWRVGAGVNLSWWDDQLSLLVDSDGERVDAHLEAAAMATGEVRLAEYGGVRLVAAADQLYWPDLGLTELRARIGISVSP